MREIKGKKSRDIYIYDEQKLTLTDKIGTTIKLYESLDGISDSNIRSDIDDLFHEYYKKVNEFASWCRSLKRDCIEWEEFK